jgi:hypothetical protein
MTDSASFLVQEFGTMVVGIGALFFAYGQSYPHPHIRLVISFVGLGASIIVTMHAINAQNDRKRIELLMANTTLMSMYKAAVRWRQEGLSGYLYFRATRLIEYFAILMVVIWSEILSNDLWDYLFGHRPFTSLEFFSIGLFVFAILLASTLIQKHKDMHGNA